MRWRATSCRPRWPGSPWSPGPTCAARSAVPDLRRGRRLGVPCRPTARRMGRPRGRGGALRRSAADPRFATEANRHANDAVLGDVLARVFVTRDRADWQRELTAVDVACVAVTTGAPEALLISDEYGCVSGYITDVTHLIFAHPSAGVRSCGSRVRLLNAKGGDLCGSATDAVLEELAYTVRADRRLAGEVRVQWDDESSRERRLQRLMTKDEKKERGQGRPRSWVSAATQYYRAGSRIPRVELSLACKAILAALGGRGAHGRRRRRLRALLVRRAGARWRPPWACPRCGTPRPPPAAGAPRARDRLGGVGHPRRHGHVRRHRYPVQQAHRRLGGSAVPTEGGGSQLTYGNAALGIASPYTGFTANDGLLGPGQPRADRERHMHQYGTKREHFAEIAISTRDNAIRRPKALMNEPIDAGGLLQCPDDRGAALPVRLHDGDRRCVAVITASADRAKDLRHPPVSSWARRTAGRP